MRIGVNIKDKSEIRNVLMFLLFSVKVYVFFNMLYYLLILYEKLSY